jgi:hypothetical protein
VPVIALKLYPPSLALTGRLLREPARELPLSLSRTANNVPMRVARGISLHDAFHMPSSCGICSVSQRGAMGTQKELEAALAEAEAELARAVADRDAAAADVAEASDKVEKARAHCRQARTALTEQNRAEPAAAPVERTATSSREVKKPSKEPVARPRKTLRGHISSLLARQPALARQSFMLLALVLAYLQYYFIDVNLKVSMLPSITVLVFG